MFSKPKIYTNMEKEIMNIPSGNLKFPKDEVEEEMKTPEEISYMLTREMFLQTPTDVYWWFNNLSSRHQKIMMKGFVDCLNMDETHIKVWGNENNNDNEDNIPMDIANNKTSESSIILPSIVRSNIEPISLLDISKGHPNVTERNNNNNMDIDDHDTNNYFQENTLLVRQSSNGINNENMMDVELESTVVVE